MQREIGWGIYLAGLPFAHFALYSKQINQWYAQTFWAEGGIALLCGMALSSGRLPAVRNVPLGCWFAWVCLSTLGLWITFLRHDWGHPIGLLSPLAHVSCLLLWYLAAVGLWSRDVLKGLLRWVAVSGVVILIYGVLQLWHLDQFYRWIDATKLGQDAVIGTIGNQAYFGMHLAFLLPVFLWLGTRWASLAALAASVMALATLSTSALVCVWAAWMWWGWYELPRRWWIGLVSLSAMGIIWWILSHPYWLNPSGRLEAWSAFWQHYMVGDGKQQITGAGLGRIMGDSHLGLAGWPHVSTDVFRHAHSEYFQVLIEQGVIGLGLVGWMVWDAVGRWRALPKTPLVKTLGGCGMLVLMAACVNNSFHYWVLGMFGLLAYCGVYVLSSEARA